MIAADLVARIQVLIDLGLGYLALNRRTPTVSPGELQRLRLATQLRAGLFGVLYVLDEPSAGLHPADAEPLLDVLDRLRRAGNSLFVVEHDMDVVRRADWIVDVGPGAGELGGEVLYSGPVAGLADVAASVTRRLPVRRPTPAVRRTPRKPSGMAARCAASAFTTCATSTSTCRSGVYTAVTGVSGSGKSTLVYKVLGDVVTRHLGVRRPDRTRGRRRRSRRGDRRPRSRRQHRGDGDGVEAIDRLVAVDQRPIGRTPRSTLATYTGLFDAVRRVFAATPAARAPGWTAGRFSFNVAEGRCPTCQGEGFVSVELLFLPGTYGTCPTCHGARYNEATLRVRYRDRTIADVLAMTVDEASEFFADVAAAARSLDDTARGRAGLSASRAARDRAVRRRGAAHQAGVGTAAAPARPHALRARRAHHRAASRRRRPARRAAAPPRRRGQHRGGGRARHAGGRRVGLGDRPRTRRGRCRRARGRGGHTAEVGQAEGSRTAPYLAARLGSLHEVVVVADEPAPDARRRSCRRAGPSPRSSAPAARRERTASAATSARRLRCGSRGCRPAGRRGSRWAARRPSRCRRTA